MYVRCAEMRPRPFDHLRGHGVAAHYRLSVECGGAGNVRYVALRGCAVIAGLWSGLRACDDHHGVGNYPAFGLRAARDLHGIAVARVHLVGAQPHPDAAVSPLVDFDLLHSRGGADLETSLRVVALCGGPAGVDSIETLCRDPHFEPSGGYILRRPDVSVVFTVAGQSIVALLPFSARRVEVPGRSVVDDLRVGGRRLHDRERPRRRLRRGFRPLRLRSHLARICWWGVLYRPAVVEAVVAWARTLFGVFRDGTSAVILRLARALLVVRGQRTRRH